MDRLPAFVKSARLILRLWTEGDVAALSAAKEASLDHLRLWMPWAVKEPASLEEDQARIRRWREEWERGGDSVVGIFRDEVVVGGAGLHRRVGPGGVEIGYWIHVDHIRRGFATEAAGALTAAAFEVPGIDRVEIHHDLANIASGKVARRLGFTLVERVDDESEAPGEVGIECRWVASRSAWTPKPSEARERAVAGLLRRDGRVLLCHRHPDRASSPNVWDLPGGHIGSRESPAEALVRELGEELGIEIETPEGAAWVVMLVDGFVLNVFLVDRWLGEPHNAATREHDDIRWVTPEDIPQLDLAHSWYSQLLKRASE